MESRSFFEKLPDELFVEISTYFQTKNFIAPGAVNRRFHNLFSDERKLASNLAHKLHTHVVRGEKVEAENLLKLLPSLLTVKGMVTDYSGRCIYGTALQIALGAEDVNQEGKCVLITVAPPFTRAQMNQIDFGSPAAYVRCGDKLFYVDKTNNEFKEIPLDEAILMKFDAENNPQTEPRTLSEEQLKNITSLTGHIHDEGMAQMLQRYMRKLPHGEEIIAAQTGEQFPDGWEQAEVARAQRDAQRLQKVFAAITRSKEDETCEEAIKEFKAYLEQENKGKGVIKTGKHSNHQLLVEAFRAYDDNYINYGGWDSRKNNLAWRKVIGGIQRWVPTATAMALAQGAFYMVEDGEKLKRSLEFQHDRGFYFYPLNLDPSFRLGEEYACVLLTGAGASVVRAFGELSPAVVFYELCRTKSINLSQLMPPRRDKTANNWCALM